jgi:nitrite reductase/ring-hydroxylating ferredoxin subunit
MRFRYFPRNRLCRLDDFEDPGSKAFSEIPPVGLMDFLVVRQGARVYGYLNTCPHTGGPLDWVPGQFLDVDREYIQCATHAALFRITDGECVYGPCAGDRLTPVPVAVEAGDVILLVQIQSQDSLGDEPDCPRS